MPFSTQTPPAVLSRDSEHADLFVIGTDGRVWTNWWALGQNDNRWAGWFPITDKPDDPITASFSKQTPPAVLSRDSEHADVFVIGTDGRVWTNWWALGQNDNRWAGWFPITDKPDDPTAASFSKQTPPAVLSRDSEHADVFVIGTDGRVWTNWWALGQNDNRWAGWFPITDKPDDPTTASFSKQTPPAVLSRDSEHADLFVIGTDGRVWTNWWALGQNDNRWAGWFPITDKPDDPTAASFSKQTPPAVLSRDSEHVDLFVIGTDGRVWTNWWALGQNDNRWAGWFPITDKPDDPITASFSKQTPPAVLSRDSEHVDVFVIGTDGRVWTNWWALGQNDNRWAGWFPITDKPDDPTAASFSKQTPPAVLSRDSEHADVFVIGTDGRVWTNWWALGQNDNRWAGWYPIPETPTKVVRVKVLRYLWASPAPDALASLQWPDDAYADIFSNANGWSLREYWWRATLGLIDLRFDIAPWHVLHQQQADVMKDRNKILEVCRTQALNDDGVSFEGFQHIIAFVHAPPSDAGANGQFGDAVFDQNPFTLGFYQHELGHLLGFEHAFGPGGPYDDDYCVMGASRRQERSFPAFASFSRVDLLPGVDLFHSERRLAAAGLYRYMDDFKASPSVHRVDSSQPTTVTLVALSEASYGEPVLAVLGTQDGELTVEYRTDRGDDSGVEPAAVVHSIGRHDPGEGKHEVDPIWFETAVPAQVGAQGQVGNLVVDVISIAPDRRTMTLTIHP